MFSSNVFGVCVTDIILQNEIYHVRSNLSIETPFIRRTNYYQNFWINFSEIFLEINKFTNQYYLKLLSFTCGHVLKTEFRLLSHVFGVIGYVHLGPITPLSVTPASNIPLACSERVQ